MCHHQMCAPFPRCYSHVPSALVAGSDSSWTYLRESRRTLMPDSPFIEGSATVVDCTKNGLSKVEKNVDLVKCIQPDSIVIGCVQLTEDGNLLAINANMKNTDQHIMLLGWSADDDQNEASIINIEQDNLVPRIELQGTSRLPTRLVGLLHDSL
ncbi:hypothetical protein VNO78_06483 [Psophocarpus tetragonolobus]|uniref:Uncharacterized protein n=1 Tax=Psophocarpus tetragonolobus TaxID=3891 RepID=A0AAN9SSC5_PSOTE